MVNWNQIKNKLSPAASAAGGSAKKAGQEATKTMPRRAVLATGGAALADIALFNGDVFVDGTVNATGNLVEEHEDPPMSMEGIGSVSDYNRVVDQFLSEDDSFKVNGTTYKPLSDFNAEAGQDLNTQAGELPNVLEDGDTFADDKYIVLESSNEAVAGVDSGDEAVTASFSGQGNEWFALTNEAFETAGFDDYAFLAINSKDNEIDYDELRRGSLGYRHAAGHTDEAVDTVNHLIELGESYTRGGKEFEDEDELENYRDVKEKVEELKDVRDRLSNRQNSWESFSGLFGQTLEKTPYEDGASVGPDAGEPEEPKEPQQYTVTDNELEEYWESTDGFDHFAKNIEEGSATQNTIYRKNGSFKYDNGDVVTTIPEEFAKDLKDFVN